ncbi:hypothetical protein BO70DRAFT_389608 [Aspergillus heteromorphus CBS 117.55]|uniref:CCCH zinc finger and RRM domain protein n=1 Tax=Aspergillus heteromorphus CBS 117.55 TaxID=1448321 RepID=A0A317VEY5_9EURO|nr:uncharacterized protein BO70DRAFT_389608 [Aspergillus heteromorphus CBS 117.55]PWY71761.1 hypothetical protein BO70DRAFT_389608 [Aspergillus heteromorphus CBS 117.55]
MQLTENEANEVKMWVVKKLEDISDADSDVLADYVLALIRTDAPDDEIRKASVENLEDFLREHTNEFVDELFDTFASKPPAPAAPTFAQGQSTDGPASGAPSQPPHPFSSPAGQPKGPYGAPMGGIPQSQLENPNFNRKRSYHEGFQAEQERDDAPHNRAFKTPRRGRGGGRGDWMGRDGRAGPGVPPQFHHPGAFQVMPPAFPGFDQNDPMAAMMALQSMGFPQMPGMPPMPMPPQGGGPGPSPEQMGPKSSERCPFYETQGICYLGATCPYQHDAVPGGQEDEYDPASSNLVTDFQRRTDPPMRGGERGRGRGRGGERGGFGGRGRRSEFSAAGPNDDASIVTIVVEQIPDDKLDEANVREFFSQYGEIVDISLQLHRRLALITFADHAAAKRAWSSPKVIFDNRFVKVYWHKPRNDRNGEQRPAGDGSEGPSFDREEFERQQEEAQKVHEEKLKKRKETEEAKQALERQREELLKKQQEEKQRLLQRLGGQDSSNGTSAAAARDDDGQTQEDVSDQTRKLRAQLAALEAEAQSLGIDPTASPYSYRGRGRGFGRGSFAPRGRGGYDPSYRGGYRGRGGGIARGRGGVLRLDNRPRRVAVSGVEFTPEKDEALRQFLIGVGEYESIEPSAEQPDSLVIAFKERYLAEKFMFGTRDIPSVGQVQLTWVANPPISLGSTSGSVPSDMKTASDEDTVMDIGAEGGRKDGGVGAGQGQGHADVDYDVAEVDDSWGVE